LSKDFGELVFRQKLLSVGVVLLRMKGATGAQKAEAVKKLLKAYGGKVRGHFVVVTAKKCRFAPIKGWF